MTSKNYTKIIRYVKMAVNNENYSKYAKMTRKLCDICQNDSYFSYL